MKPAAIEKAESLAHFANQCGAPLAEFELAITRAEAYELLDFLEKGGFGPPCDVLLKDIEQARRDANPWQVLQHFNLQGLTIGKVEGLH
jgi:hypothetical protein